MKEFNKKMNDNPTQKTMPERRASDIRRGKLGTDLGNESRGRVNFRRYQRKIVLPIEDQRESPDMAETLQTSRTSPAFREEVSAPYDGFQGKWDDMPKNPRQNFMNNPSLEIDQDGQKDQDLSPRANPQPGRLRGRKNGRESLRKADRKKSGFSVRTWAIFLFVVFLVFTGALLLRHKAFNVKYIRVEGNTVLSDEEITEQLGNSNRNIFLYSKQEIRKTLMQMPGIRSVQVKKELPNRLVITIEESYVLAETDQEPPLFVDNGGKVLDKIPDGFSSRIKPLRVSFPGRHLERGKTFSTDKRELDFLLTLSHSMISDDVKKVVFNKSNNIDIILKDVKVYFGPLDNIFEKVSTLTAVYNEIQSKGVDAREIILNQGKNPIVVTDRAPKEKNPSSQSSDQEKEQGLSQPPADENPGQSRGTNPDKPGQRRGGAN